MSAIAAIARRELGSFFDTPLGWLVLAALTATFGFFFFFVHDALGAGIASLRGFFGTAPLVLALFTPLITMRLLAGERASGTWELLLTLPVADGAVVLGKFLAGAGVLWLGCLGTLPFVAIVGSLGPLDPGPVLAGYLGLALVAAAYTAVGLLCSAWSDSPMAGAVSGLLACLGLWVVDKVALRVPGVVGEALRWAGIDGHAANLGRGIIDSRDLVYFAALIAVSLAGAAWAVAHPRQVR